MLEIELGSLEEQPVLFTTEPSLQPHQAARRERQWAWPDHLKPQSPLPVTHFLQQDHTS
ncbi:hypothetical protein LEMLEM_LOCUS21827 [Lemmus lemmus]